MERTWQLISAHTLGHVRTWVTCDQADTYAELLGNKQAGKGLFLTALPTLTHTLWMRNTKWHFLGLLQHAGCFPSPPASPWRRPALQNWPTHTHTHRRTHTQEQTHTLTHTHINSINYLSSHSNLWIVSISAAKVVKKEKKRKTLAGRIVLKWPATHTEAHTHAWTYTRMITPRAPTWEHVKERQKERQRSQLVDKKAKRTWLTFKCTEADFHNYCSL